MSRRAFLLAAAAATIPALAQPAKMERRRVACLYDGDEAGVASFGRRVEKELLSGGFVAGVNLEVRCFRAAREAAAWTPDAILAPGPALALSARDATRSIPVVFFAVPDPEILGLVETLRRPGGNATGSAVNASALTLKRLELVRELLPRARRVALLFRKPPAATLLLHVKGQVVESAARLDFRPEDAEVGAGGRGFTATLAELARRPPDAVLPFGPYDWEPDGADVDVQGPLLEFERRWRVPVIHDSEEAVAAGATAAIYDVGSQFRVAIAILARILKGASAALIPVEFPLRAALAVNPSAASAIGLTLPPSVMIRADRVVG